MRHALLTVVIGLAGCASNEGSPAPSAVASTPPLVHGPTAGTSVPAGALVSPGDLGSGWTAAGATATPCAPAVISTAARSVGLAEARGTLTETVSTRVDVASAVASWRRSLHGCGYTTKDFALGDAAVAAHSSDGVEAVLVTGTEGVLVVLHAHGALARAEDELEGWADLALGTSCVAAPDGCH